jgi:hypothetical protein
MRTREYRKADYCTVLHDIVRKELGYGRLITREELNWTVFSSSVGSGFNGIDLSELVDEMVQFNYFHKVKSENPDDERYILLNKDSSKLVKSARRN